jgi:hypothetical protein
MNELLPLSLVITCTLVGYLIEKFFLSLTIHPSFH